MSAFCSIHLSTFPDTRTLMTRDSGLFTKSNQRTTCCKYYPSRYYPVKSNWISQRDAEMLILSLSHSRNLMKAGLNVRLAPLQLSATLCILILQVGPSSYHLNIPNCHSKFRQSPPLSLNSYLAPQLQSAISPW